ncbi:hypothetical protein G9A89_023108 [Geosiphon pyriformis]|nr:hypothetical protein G9A89_023108 [Geosiphon pyriformis]
MFKINVTTKVPAITKAQIFTYERFASVHKVFFNQAQRHSQGFITRKFSLLRTEFSKALNLIPTNTNSAQLTNEIERAKEAPIERVESKLKLEDHIKASNEEKDFSQSTINENLNLIQIPAPEITALVIQNLNSKDKNNAKYSDQTCLTTSSAVLDTVKRKFARWTKEEDQRLRWAIQYFGVSKWEDIYNAAILPNRTKTSISSYYHNVISQPKWGSQLTNEIGRAKEAPIERVEPKSRLEDHIKASNEQKDFSQSTINENLNLIQIPAPKITALVIQNLNSKDNNNAKYSDQTCLTTSSAVLNTVKRKFARWTKEEDQRLRWAIQYFGVGKWKNIYDADILPNRTKTSISSHYHNVISHPKRGSWKKREEEILLESIEKFGPKWSKISTILRRPGPAIFHRYHEVMNIPNKIRPVRKKAVHIKIEKSEKKYSERLNS